MRRNLVFIGLLLAGFFLANAAYCEMIQGMITYRDPVNKMIAVRETPVAHTSAKVKMVLVKSAKDLKVGQLVTVDAHPGLDGQTQTLQARSIATSA